MTRHYSTFVLAPHDSTAAESEEMDSVAVRRFPYFWPRRLQKLADGKGILANIRGSLLAWLQVPFFLFREALAFARVVRENNIGIVNSHWLVPQGVIAAFFKKRYGFVHAITVHAADVFLLNRLPFGKRVARYIVENADLIIPVSKHNHDLLRGMAGRDFKSLILPMGVDVEFFGGSGATKPKAELSVDPSKRTILFVGKLTEKKGVVYLIRAMKELLTKLPDVQLAIVGDGYLRPELEKESLELGNAVKFVGQKSRDEVRDYLQVAEALVVPSIIDRHGETEGVPLVILEAMAAGRPIVATDVGGNSQMVFHGENGYIVREKDPSGIAESLLSLLSEGRASGMGRKSLEIIKDLDWKIVGERYKTAIEQSCRQPRPSHKP
ncbi:MAG: glycosyltransferase [Nitrospinae bacterium]|nr:glycosyltransferase [Nitrospinota bacterium]